MCIPPVQNITNHLPAVLWSSGQLVLVFVFHLCFAQGMRRKPNF